MARKLRKGDEVLVIAGNDRGKVVKILRCEGESIVVEGVNVRKKHMRRTQENQKGQIIDLEKPIHISNVKVCVDEKPVKLKVRLSDANERELYYSKGKEKTLYRPMKKSHKK